MEGEEGVHAKDLLSVVVRANEDANAEQEGPEGTTRRWITAYVLLHLMNHATHHRGRISQILDEEGIEHDYSGILQAMRGWEQKKE